jgi:hypothetical protein
MPVIMIKYLSAVCCGKTVQELEHDLNASIALEEQAKEGQLIELINVSLSSCYDFKEGCLVHTAVIIWSYKQIKGTRKSRAK